MSQLPNIERKIISNRILILLTILYFVTVNTFLNAQIYVSNNAQVTVSDSSYVAVRADEGYIVPSQSDIATVRAKEKPSVHPAQQIREPKDLASNSKAQLRTKKIKIPEKNISSDNWVSESYFKQVFFDLSQSSALITFSGQEFEVITDQKYCSQFHQCIDQKKSCFAVRTRKLKIIGVFYFPVRPPPRVV